MTYKADCQTWASGNRANGPASLSGQNRPKHEEIQIARVIGKINALRGVRPAADPSRLNSREEPYTFCQQLRDHVTFNCRASRLVLRIQVIRVPRPILRSSSGGHLRPRSARRPDWQAT